MLAFLVQRIEGMEELLLRLFLARQKLNIVDQKHIYTSIFIAKLYRFVVPDRVDKFVGKLFRRQINDFRRGIMLNHIMADRMHQVGLAESNSSVNKQWIVRFRRRFRHSKRSRMCKAVS